MQYWKVKIEIFRAELKKYLVWSIRRIRSWQSCIWKPSMLFRYLDWVHTSPAFRTLLNWASWTFLTSISSTSFLLHHIGLLLFIPHIALSHLGAVPFNSLLYFNQNPIYQKWHRMPVGISLGVSKAVWSCFNYHT